MVKSPEKHVLDLPYIFNLCDFISQDKIVLLEHKLIHSDKSNVSNNKALIQTKETKKSTNFCTKCHFLSENVSILENHITIKHKREQLQHRKCIAEAVNSKNTKFIKLDKDAIHKTNEFLRKEEQSLKTVKIELTTGMAEAVNVNHTQSGECDKIGEYKKNEITILALKAETKMRRPVQLASRNYTANHTSLVTTKEDGGTNNTEDDIKSVNLKLTNNIVEADNVLETKANTVTKKV